MTKKEREVSKMVLSGAVWGRLQGEGERRNDKEGERVTKMVVSGAGWINCRRRESVNCSFQELYRGN